MSTVNLLAWIVVGLVAGGLARWIVKDERTGCLYTLVIGVLGALLGGALVSAVGGDGIGGFSLRTVVVAAVGAVLLLLVLEAIAGRRR